MAQSLADSVRNIPPVTRFFTITTVVVCLACSLELLKPFDLAFNTDIALNIAKIAYHNFAYGPSWIAAIKAVLWGLTQSYRFFSCFLVPIGIYTGQRFEAILDIYFFYTFANHVESGKFRGNFADCLWFTLLTGTIIIIVTFVYGLVDPQHYPFHHQMMLACITYIWSRSSKNSIINFLGLVPIKAYYLPLFNIFFKLIINGYPSFFDTFIGIVGGYLYQCIQSDTIPIYNLFSTSYSKFTKNSNGQKVGTTTADFNSTNSDIILDSIFDKGYLKAPIWLYNVLDYPINNSKRTTAFTKIPRKPVPEPNNTGSWFSGGAFKGKGHRLGD